MQWNAMLCYSLMRWKNLYANLHIIHFEMSNLRGKFKTEYYICIFLVYLETVLDIHSYSIYNSQLCAVSFDSHGIFLSNHVTYYTHIYIEKPQYSIFTLLYFTLLRIYVILLHEYCIIQFSHSKINQSSTQKLIYAQQSLTVTRMSVKCAPTLVMKKKNKIYVSKRWKYKSDCCFFKCEFVKIACKGGVSQLTDECLVVGRVLYMNNMVSTWFL